LMWGAIKSETGALNLACDKLHVKHYNSSIALGGTDQHETNRRCTAGRAR
jgi:hypothetical protein